MLNILSDMRFAVRLMGRMRGVSAVAIATLALGCAAGATVFSALNAILFRELPVRAPRQIVRFVVTGNTGHRSRATFSYPEYRLLADAATSTEGVLATEPAAAAVRTGAGIVQSAGVEIVSTSYFSLLGVPLATGRGFAASEETPGSQSRVAIVSDAFWRSTLGAKPDAVGSLIDVNGVRFEVIGVIAGSFRGTNFAVPHDLLIPLGGRDAIRPVAAASIGAAGQAEPTLQLIARLKPHASIDEANADLSRISANVSATRLFENQKVTAVPERAGLIAPSMPSSVTIVWSLGLGLIAAIIVVVMMNLAAVFTARSVARETELALRVSLGASRGRLYRQLVLESLTIAVPAIGAALLLTLWSGTAYRAFLPPTAAPLLLDFDPDWHVLLVTVAIGLGSVLGATLISARHVLHGDVFDALRGRDTGTVRENRLFGALTAVQFAACAVSFVGGIFTIATMINYERVDVGVDVAQTIIGTVSETGRHDTGAFERRLVDAVRRLPVVTEAALATQLPISPSNNRATVEDAGGQRIDVGLNFVSDEYFQTMGVSLVNGRFFDRRDVQRDDVAVVNQTLARELPPPVIGARLRFVAPGRTVEVVGIAHDVKYECLACPPRPFVFQPLANNAGAPASVHARVRGDVNGAVNAVRESLASAAGPGTVPDVRTTEMLVDADRWVSRTSAAVVGTLAAMIGVLSAVGLYGLVAFRIQRSRRQLAIRVALGARRSDVFRFLTRPALIACGGGAAIGLLLSVGVMKLAGGLLLGVATTDRRLYAMAVAALAVVGALALAAPVLRAVRQNMSALLR